MKICDIHFKQMDMPDRDPAHVLHADEECRSVLTKFPNSRFAPQAAQRVRQVQEVIAEGEFRVGDYYHHKASYSAAVNRLHAVSDQYPLYSQADLALWEEGDSYLKFAKMSGKFKDRAIAAFQKLVREYPLSPYSEDAKKRLKEMEADIPEPDPVAMARQRYELANVGHRSTFDTFWGFITAKPDTTHAAKSGEPATSALRPSIPPSVPVPAGGSGGVTDITAETVGGTASVLDKQKDDRLSKQNAAAAGDTKPADAAKSDSAAKPDDSKAASSGPKIPSNDEMVQKQLNVGPDINKKAKPKKTKRPSLPKEFRPSTPKKQKPVVSGTPAASADPKPDQSKQQDSQKQ
jgi:outer membrane protein assembly factor BamD